MVGGKWTTFRLMALDLVERLAKDLGLALPPSKSHATPLLGAGPRPPLPLPEEAARRLWETYGTLAPEVLALGDRPLLPGLPYLEGEVVWAVRRELARKPLDVLARRMGLAFWTKRRPGRPCPRWWSSWRAFSAGTKGSGPCA